MIKKLAFLSMSSLLLSFQCFAQDATFNNLTIGQLIKGAGSQDYNGWGLNTSNAGDTRPDVNSPAFVFNNRSGLTFSAHSQYGGIRFYNQGYPSGPFSQASGATMVMSIVNNSVGIGTTAPRAVLDVGNDLSNGKLGTVFGRLEDGDNIGIGTFLGVRGYTANSNIAEGKSFAIEHTFYGRINSSINFFRGGDTQGGFISFNTGINIEQMRIDKAGNVGIGTTTPAEKLSVNGNIRAREIKVETANWPDYVFEPAYEQLSLPELELFIQRNKHLPEIPSAKTVAAEGVSLGDINAKLLKKIEELTLYTIEQHKRLDAKDQEIKELNLWKAKIEDQLSKLIAAQKN